MTLLCLVPVLLSFGVLAAHFLFHEAAILAVAAVAAALLLLVSRRWAVRVIQVCLVIAALEWIRTVAVIAGRRIADGEPWHRMAVIVLGAAVFSAASALVFYLPPLRRRYGLTDARSAGKDY